MTSSEGKWGDAVTLAVEHHVAQVTLNRPDAYNALDPVMQTGLVECLRGLPDRGDVRVIVFAANGRVFSAGGDFDAMLADNADPVRRRAAARHGRPLLMAFADCPLPVVTALHGDAVGLGATLILCTDAIVAAKSARLSDPHVAVGLAAGDGGAILWPASVGLLRAKRHLLTGDRLTAEAAFSMGLVTDLVDTPEDALPAARALATRMAKLPPLAVQATKRTLNQGLRHRIEEIYDYGLALEMETMASEDLVEAVTAFKERRPPTYQGK